MIACLPGLRISPLRLSMTIATGIAALLCQPLAHADSIATGSRYVALGSSYAAGPGVGRKDTSGGNCARSLDNYAHQLAAKRGLNIVDVSCSGATTDQILTRSQAGFAPQIESVTADTALVTMTIGGNDISYIGNLLGKSCRDEALKEGKTGSSCTLVSEASVAQKIVELPGKLDAVIAAVRQRAPRATIVMVNYLPVLPHTGICSGIALSTEDAAAIRRTYDKLATIEKNQAQANGVIFIPSAHIGQGHDACSASPYTATYHPPVTPTWSSPAAYHPTIAGMRAMANAIDKALGK